MFLSPVVQNKAMENRIDQDGTEPNKSECLFLRCVQIAHPAALCRVRSIMQYVAIVECLRHIRSLAAKVGAVVFGAATDVANEKVAPGMTDHTDGRGRASEVSVTGRRAVKGMEELAHALGALEALLAEGAGDTSASGKATYPSPLPLRENPRIL